MGKYDGVLGDVRLLSVCVFVCVDESRNKRKSNWSYDNNNNNWPTVSERLSKHSIHRACVFYYWSLQISVYQQLQQFVCRMQWVVVNSHIKYSLIV